MQTYILVDTANMFMRARHVVRGDDMYTKIGMSYHIMFNSINKVWREQKGTHVVIALEGRSWRKDFYEPYKANRKASRDALTPAEQEEDKAFWQAFDELKEYIDKRTNCTVLQHPECEADDFIARWIQNHPDDEHVIVSSDSDFYQLLTDKVTQYNGITNQHIKLDGIVNDKGKPELDRRHNARDMWAQLSEHMASASMDSSMMTEWVDPMMHTHDDGMMHSHPEGDMPHTHDDMDGMPSDVEPTTDAPMPSPADHQQS